MKNIIYLHLFIKICSCVPWVGTGHGAHDMNTNSKQ